MFFHYSSIDFVIYELLFLSDWIITQSLGFSFLNFFFLTAVNIIKGFNLFPLLNPPNTTVYLFIYPPALLIIEMLYYPFFAIVNPYLSSKQIPISSKLAIRLNFIFFSIISFKISILNFLTSSSWISGLIINFLQALLITS